MEREARQIKNKNNKHLLVTKEKKRKPKKTCMLFLCCQQKLTEHLKIHKENTFPQIFPLKWLQLQH